MKFISKVGLFFKKYLFNVKWRCLSCGKEIFDGEYFCGECKSKLPYNNENICLHCGRKLASTQKYCTTCKGRLTFIDMARSAYDYAPPVSSLIKSMKYNNRRYIAQAFAKDLANLYYENKLEADLVTYVPATKSSLKKRGYNQSELLATEFCQIIGLPLSKCLEKTKETNRQAKLSREERQKNLKDAFKVIDKKAVYDKTIIIIDDVTTTGSTAEAIAKALKNAKAEEVFLLSVASVSPKEGY